MSPRAREPTLRRRAHFVRLVFAAAALSHVGVAAAEPQGTISLDDRCGRHVAGPRPRGGDPNPREPFGARPNFHLGLRGDVLFAQKKPTDFGGVGPYAEVLTNGFVDGQFGGGASLLLPVLDTYPVVLSARALWARGRRRVRVTPGVAGTLF